MRSIVLCKAVFLLSCIKFIERQKSVAKRLAIMSNSFGFVNSL